MRKYLTNRIQIVVINGEQSSDIIDITYGVPQGSILGPMLFSLYINDSTDQAPNTTIVMYADDMAVLFSHGNSYFIEYTLNDEMKIVRKWLNKHKLTLNVNKSEVYGL